MSKIDPKDEIIVRKLVEEEDYDGLMAYLNDFIHYSTRYWLSPNYDEVEDCRQNASMEIIKSIHNYLHYRELYPIIWIIIKNSALSRRRRKMERNSEQLFDFLDVPVDLQSGLENQMEANAKLIQLLKNLDQLPTLSPHKNPNHVPTIGKTERKLTRGMITSLEKGECYESITDFCEQLGIPHHVGFKISKKLREVNQITPERGVGFLLHPEEVWSIHQDYWEKKQKCNYIGLKFGTSGTTVSNIIRGKLYNDIYTAYHSKNAVDRTYYNKIGRKLKLSKDDVLAVLAAERTIDNKKKLADQYGVTKSTINHIWNGRFHKEVIEEYQKEKLSAT